MSFELSDLIVLIITLLVVVGGVLIGFVIKPAVRHGWRDRYDMSYDPRYDHHYDPSVRYHDNRRQRKAH